MVTQILNCPGNCALIVCNCQLVFLEAYLPWQRLLIFKIMQIIYSENRGFLSSENSLWWIQYLSFRNFNCWHLTSGYRETLLIALKIPVQTLKKYYLVLSKMFFFSIWVCHHLSMLSWVSRSQKSSPPPPLLLKYIFILSVSVYANVSVMSTQKCLYHIWGQEFSCI